MKRTLPDRPTYVHRQRGLETTLRRCPQCGEKLPAGAVVDLCGECGGLVAQRKPYKPTGQFTASGVDRTFLGSRVRANPDWRFTPPGPMQPAKNMLPKNRRRHP